MLTKEQIEAFRAIRIKVVTDTAKAVKVDPSEVLDELNKLCDLALSALDSQRSGWMPIADAPKDGSRVLLSNGSSASIQVGHWEKEHDYPRMNIPAHWSDEGEGFELHPSHWMPLPSPPK